MTTATATSTSTQIAPPTFRDVLRARNTITQYLAPTPLYRYPALDALLDAAVYVKHENYQPIGAFKIRGGVNYMAHLAPEERVRGVVTASTGNHGQSVAYAARLFGIRAVIVVPEGANPVKVQAMRSYGAEVVFHGATFDESKRHCAALERDEGLRFISSGDEPLLIAGVATHTLEMLEAEPDISTIFVPVGGGSGAAGACLVAHSVNPAIRVIGMQASAAPSAYLTWKHHEFRAATNTTAAEGLATGEPFMLPQAILWEHLHDFVLVEDADLLASVRLLLEKAKTLAEPAGASPLAAALHMKEALQGQTIGLILSGGNISPEQMRACLDMQL